MKRRLLLIALTLIACTVQAAEEVYLEPSQFVSEAFDGSPPEPAQLWITGDLREQAGAILGHSPANLRTRYWRKGLRTVWILEEIGKEQPITSGFVVQDGSIEALRILIYRESRGWEIRHDFFTRQFKDAHLQDGNRLDRDIDGIAGATLSVNAMRKLARLALLYHHHVTENDGNR